MEEEGPRADDPRWGELYDEARQRELEDALDFLRGKNRSERLGEQADRDGRAPCDPAWLADRIAEHIGEPGGDDAPRKWSTGHAERSRELGRLLALLLTIGGRRER